MTAVDFQKAFDSVNRRFLHRVLHTKDTQGVSEVRGQFKKSILHPHFLYFSPFSYNINKSYCLSIFRTVL